MTDLVRWNPFREAISLREAMDRLFEDSFVHPFGSWSLAGGDWQTLAVDLYETDNELVLEASLPGFTADNVEISLTGNSLTIKGEVKHEDEKKEKGRYHVRERRYQAFQRTVTLPVAINAEAAEAVFENGVLKLTLPKVEEAKPKRISVKVK